MIYAEDTASYGNVIKGWEGYLNSKVSSKSSHHHQRDGEKKKGRIAPRDRLFSMSSSTAPRLDEDGTNQNINNISLIGDDTDLLHTMTSSSTSTYGIGDMSLTTTTSGRRASSRRAQDDDSMMLG